MSMSMSTTSVTSPPTDDNVGHVDRFLTCLHAEPRKWLQVGWVARTLAAYSDDYLLRLWTNIPSSGDRRGSPGLASPPQTESRRFRWMMELVIAYLALQVRRRDPPTMELMRSVSDSSDDRARAETFLGLVCSQLFRELAGELLLASDRTPVRIAQQLFTCACDAIAAETYGAGAGAGAAAQ